MAKSKSYQASSYQSRGKGSKGREASESYKDRDLAGMSPEAAQTLLQPTDAEPVPLHKKMAGC